MKKTTYDDYIRRFNAEDATTFDDYIHPNMSMLNGALEFHGVQGMKEHYSVKIWPYFIEQLNVLRFVSDDVSAAVHMWTHFIARADAQDTLFGAVRAGETFDYRGVIFYEIEREKFSRIIVAYNSFTYTNSKGETTHRGIPH